MQNAQYTISDHSALCILHSAFDTGGHEGTRTPNFLLVREAVYQLTYVPEDLSTKRTLAVKKTRSFSKKERTVMLRKLGSGVKFVYIFRVDSCKFVVPVFAAKKKSRINTNKN